MRPLFSDKFQNPNREIPDMGDMPIANAKYNCLTCKIKAEGCTKTVNTLNCMLAIKRFNKKVEEARNKRDSDEEDGVDQSMVADEKKALADLMKDYLDNAPTEDEDEEIASSQTPTEDKDDDDDDED